MRECINTANSNPGTTIEFNIAGPGNQSAGADSWWRISPTSGALPPITASGTIIDGTTQTTNVGDTNAGVLGVGGTVGLGVDAQPATGDEPVLPQVAGPEIEIAGGG